MEVCSGNKGDVGNPHKLYITNQKPKLPIINKHLMEHIWHPPNKYFPKYDPSLVC
jgi:hypothetical protein